MHVFAAVVLLEHCRLQCHYLHQVLNLERLLPRHDVLLDKRPIRQCFIQQTRRFLFFQHVCSFRLPVQDF